MTTGNANYHIFNTMYINYIKINIHVVSDLQICNYQSNIVNTTDKKINKNHYLSVIKR